MRRRTERSGLDFAGRDEYDGMMVDATDDYFGLEELDLMEAGETIRGHDSANQVNDLPPLGFLVTNDGKNRMGCPTAGPWNRVAPGE